LVQIEQETILRCLAKNQGDAPDIDERIKKLVEEHRRRLLEYGAAAKLEMEGRLKVISLDDDESLERAKPVTKDGKLQIENSNREARHDAQVKAAFASGPCSFIILDGSHDLSERVRRLGGGTTEYVRVTTRRYNEVPLEK
jgi:hypothetical protein